jgi:hypothetical protein
MEETYNNINDVLNNIPTNYKILEEIIDIDVQKEFFESSRSILFDPETDEIETLVNIINAPDQTIEAQKIALQKLALIDAVEAYRAIEKYNTNPKPELKAWAVLSLQQSRMVLQCSLLDEQQVFISTGLGGKEEKLRYFIIFPYKTIDIITSIQQKTLKNELEFFLAQHDGIIEEFEIYNEYATTLVLLPLKAPIPEIVRDILEECNQLGDYLTENVMITNMKKFNHEEILDILENYDRS